MASVQKQQPNVDLFDLYFRRADLDRDGRISGAEAVSFFQGSGLPKPVLAQIWAHADHRQTGFLDRAEFYNALKLVTVAQTKRELTPEIVRAALYGPAASKIPPPQINLNLLPAPQPNSSPVVPASKNNVVTASLPQNPGGTKTNASIMPENILTHDNKIMKPPLPTSSPPLHLAQGFTTQEFPRGGALPGPHPPNPSMTSDWMGVATGGNAVAASSPIHNKVTSPSMTQDGFGLAPSVSTTSLSTRPQPGPGTRPVGPQSNDTKASNVSGNGFAYDSFFGGDSFSATPSQPKQDASSHSSSSSNVPASSAFSPSSVGFQPLATPTTFGSLQSSLMTQVSGGQFQPAQSVGKPNQAVPPQTVPTSSTPGIVRGVEKSSSSQSQMPWPKITQTHVQKYTKVFVEVDTDRDGKITGEQARNLFLSWRLPREVLKQVWDLSDQDNDSMLSLREFCLALYLMERYREGRSLPPALPSEIMFNLSEIIPSTMNYSNVGFQQHRGMPGPGVQQMTHAVAPRPPRPPVPVSILQADERPPVDKPKPKIPTLEKHLVDQLSTEEQNSLNSKFKEAAEADKKVEELEKEILESKQKIEFCRVKMQELILYKSRCDNRLNEIIERASADKREVESLAKKYEEKYKQSGDVASKLSIEEATFRDIQEKKMELYRAIVKMEQDGNATDLQVSVDRIQSDLDELIKSVNDRCKKYGLRAKPTTLLELPFGWQPGIEEGAADWDEDWDTFEDEGFIFVKELTLDVQNVLAPPRQKMKLVKKKEPSTIESPIGVSSSNADFKSDKPQSSDERAVENGSQYNKNESDSAKSAPNSPFATSGMGSPSGKFSDSNFGKTIGFDASPRDKDVHSDHWGTSSVFSGDKTFDEPAWGTFDTNDDVDSVWGFNASSSTKDADHERNGDHYFGSNFGLNPIKTGSPQASGLSQNSRPFRFDDSVPSTPLYSLSNSPRRSKEGSEPAFDSFSRFDSFSMHDGFPPSNTLTRFDSMRSTKDFDPSHGFPSFDDSDPDPFGSSGPFRTSLDGQTPRRTSDNWNAF